MEALFTLTGQMPNIFLWFIDFGVPFLYYLIFVSFGQQNENHACSHDLWMHAANFLPVQQKYCLVPQIQPTKAKMPKQILEEWVKKGFVSHGHFRLTYHECQCIS